MNDHTETVQDGQTDMLARSGAATAGRVVTADDAVTVDRAEVMMVPAPDHVDQVLFAITVCGRRLTGSGSPVEITMMIDMQTLTGLVESGGHALDAACRLG